MTQTLHKNPLMAALFMIGWAVAYVTSMSFNKFISSSTPTPVIVFYRIMIAFIWLTPILMRHGGVRLLKSKVTHLHIIRGILTALTTGCTYYAYRYLPLGFATAVGLSGPLFVSLIAVLALKERFTLKKILCILAGYVGVLIIVNPKSIAIDNQILWALVAAIAGNILISGHVILLKVVSKTDQYLTILLYNTLVPLTCWGLYIIINPTLYACCYSMPQQDIYLLLGIGLAGLLLQYCYTRAIVYEDASFVSPLEYIRIVVAIPVGIFAFNESLNLFVILGSVIIMLASYTLFKSEEKTPH